MYRVVALVCGAGALSVGGAVALVMAQSGAFTWSQTPSLAHAPDAEAAPQGLTSVRAVTRMPRPVVGPQDAARAPAPTHVPLDHMPETPAQARPAVTQNTIPASPFSDLATLGQPGPATETKPMALQISPETGLDAPMVVDAWQIGVFR